MTSDENRWIWEEAVEGERVRRAPGPVGARLENGLLIIDTASGAFIELNRTAADLWDLLDTPRTLAELCAALLDRYEVPAEQCLAQVEQWIRAMSAQELVVIDRAEGPERATPLSARARNIVPDS